MWLTAGVVASLRGIGRGEECRCDTECESEGRRASEQRGARGPSVTGAALTGSALGSERPGLDERMMRRAADCLGKQSHPFCADNWLRGACLLSPSLSFPFIVKDRKC